MYLDYGATLFTYSEEYPSNTTYSIHVRKWVIYSSCMSTRQRNVDHYYIITNILSLRILWASALLLDNDKKISFSMQR